MENNNTKKIEEEIRQYKLFKIQTVRHKQEKQNRMTNLLQENEEMENQRTIAHLFFADTQKKADPKNLKELFFANTRLKRERYDTK